MNIKSFLFTVLAVTLFGAAFGQDKIMKKNGEVIEAKVKAITTEGIVFKKFDNPDGPDYTVPKSEVAKIKYLNGTEDVFDENEDHIGVKSEGKNFNRNGRIKERILANNNVISLAPICILDNGYGVGATYERYIDKSGWVSLYLPAFIGFHNSGTSSTGGAIYDPMFFFNPGVKIYTNLSSTRKGKFAIGPSLFMGIGRSTISTFDINYNQTTASVSHFMLGALLNFGWNYFPASHVYMGFDFGLGMTYINHYSGIDAASAASTGINNDAITEVGQLTFRVGYRYADKKKVGGSN